MSLSRDGVVATDLRGYGASGKPPSTPDHAPYRMRALATDQVEVMAALGFDRFAVAGHDREWATDVRGGPVDAGHFLPEEAPEETLRHLRELLPPA